MALMDILGRAGRFDWTRPSRKPMDIMRSIVKPAEGYVPETKGAPEEGGIETEPKAIIADDETTETAPDDEAAEGTTSESIHADTVKKIGEVLKGHNTAMEKMQAIQAKSEAAKEDAKKMRPSDGP